ncbi:hypothetical protein C6V83_18000 [Gordonia iterans]|uniref:Uncharacterized protein n=1 Tax=Gordonia iterans TaxID=1004901 RepID=A0A2S0KJQ3_9ACTN|nr:hypothetical protein [Gordonia iterans]AVM01871.1 hypothetical protein C6V83_18000 [Gordonia iterans]
MAYTAPHRRACAEAIAALGAKITVHSGDPGTTGANRIGSLEGTTTWAAAVDGPADPETGRPTAECVGTPVAFTIPASTSCTHYGIWNGSTFLVGEKLTPGITVNSEGALPTTVTPRRRFVG